MNAAVICQHCASRTTRHPSQLCSRCRRKADIPIRLCACCENHRTRDASGLCYQCRNKRVSHNYDITRIDEAIGRCESTLQILRLKAEGHSFRDIGARMSLPKSTVANTFLSAVYSGARGNSFGYGTRDDTELN